MRLLVTSPLLAALGLLSLDAAAKTPADMEPLTWMAVPDTKLRDVQADPKLYADLQGNGFENIIFAWNGGVLDTQRLRLIIWGGGHNDYYGNEMYAFDIEALQWERLTDPTVDWTDCGDPNADGTANSRHTYSGMEYIAHADRFFVTGGALNCTVGSCGADITWVFDFDTLTWTDRQPAGGHSTECENSAAYDPVTETVYFGDVGGLYAYHYDDNTWTQLNSDYLYAQGVVIDPTRGILLMIADGEVGAYDIAGGNWERQVWKTTGGDDFIAGTDMGLAYDPTTDRVVGWAGGAVHTLDLDTREWTVHDIPGYPKVDDNRVWGRWRYVPGINAFILVTDVDDDVHFFKLSEGGMIPPMGGDSSGGSTGSGDTSAPTSGAGEDDVADSTAGSATAGTTAVATGGTNAADGGGGDGGGCGCRSTGGPGGAMFGLLTIASLLRRRRR